ncbi:putative zinc metalloproteinase YIL108W isoform X2 [Stegodyphus dumicola]|uniref:putative zinc metalloproteinase YIL108W isoform X2 n=1 Tax=Stegodyphus dumicola TaxID=202533 RepID=UPI0015AFBDF9|nr:putative zinc metalloproteinase YIL108W isoform X2 [Stegodyphus dumicola]
MTIKIINYKQDDRLNISLPLIVGEVFPGGDSTIEILNKALSAESVIWPVLNGRFKVLVHLKPGENKIGFKYKDHILDFNLIYEPLKFKRFIRLVYIKCKDDEGRFQAPPEENNSIYSACNRIRLGARMLQTFTGDKIGDHKLQRKTFCLEENNGDVICHVFTSSLTLNEAYKLNDEQLWSNFAVELMNSNLRVNNDCKFLAFLSFTRYHNNTMSPPRNYKEILQMTKGQVALGGGGLALFGSGCLHTWPENLHEVPWRFGDKRRIDRMQFMDDSANRGWYWACYSTGLGATLHELGHTFDLGHTKSGIMGRGFDDIYKYFIVDMFYHDHMFQKLYNPYYQVSSVQNCTVSLSPTSPVSWEPEIETPLYNLHFQNINDSTQSKEKVNSNNLTHNRDGEVPWRSPNPPDVYYNDPNLAVNVGGAFWARSSALLLYYHRWFNDKDEKEEAMISFDGMKLSSSHGIRIVEFRDAEGTSCHHIEFLEGEKKTVDLSLCDISEYASDRTQTVSFVAEDSMGNVFKSKLDITQLLFKKNQTV